MKPTDYNMEDIALGCAFGGYRQAAFERLLLEKNGLTYRKGKTFSDVVKATQKAFRTAPFSTECHLSLLSAYLHDILKPQKKKTTLESLQAQVNELQQTINKLGGK